MFILNELLGGSRFCVPTSYFSNDALQLNK